VFVGIFLLTALFGRVWCGWACPQTVYMEFLFRPIERLIEGDHNAQAKIDRERVNGRRLAKFAVFGLVSFGLGNVFLSYFVGTDTLAHWMRQSPSVHPNGFLVMAATASLVFFDFGVFREQMCTVACPYARLQSVLLDKRSLIVGYDEHRGEPRGKKGTTKGDCVDCKLCVAACPTGIDIRAGLQLECIGCTQCIDACDGVMTKLKRPIGLIRYTSKDALAKHSVEPGRLLRPRVVIYPAILAVLLVALVVVGRGRTTAEVTLLRGIDAPFVEQGGLIENHMRVKIRNRTDEAQAYTVTLLDAPDANLIAPENPMHVAPGAQETESMFVMTERAKFVHGVRAVRVRISDGSRFTREIAYRLLGPEGR
jgi:cytochrome c oxidase accessory protein FixG